MQVLMKWRAAFGAYPAAPAAQEIAALLARAFGIDRIKPAANPRRRQRENPKKYELSHESDNDAVPRYKTTHTARVEKVPGKFEREPVSNRAVECDQHRLSIRSQWITHGDQAGGK